MTALILTIAYNPPFALLMSLSLTLAMIVTLGGALNDLLVAMGGQATAILTLRSIRTRTRLVKVGIGAGLAYLAMTVATELLHRPNLEPDSQRFHVGAGVGHPGRLSWSAASCRSSNAASPSSPMSACWNWATARIRSCRNWSAAPPAPTRTA